MQEKLSHHLGKEMMTKSIRDRITQEREERKKKLHQSKKSVHDGRRLEVGV